MCFWTHEDVPADVTGRMPDPVHFGDYVRGDTKTHFAKRKHEISAFLRSAPPLRSAATRRSRVSLLQNVFRYHHGHSLRNGCGEGWNIATECLAVQTCASEFRMSVDVENNRFENMLPCVVLQSHRQRAVLRQDEVAGGCVMCWFYASLDNVLPCSASEWMGSAPSLLQMKVKELKGDLSCRALFFLFVLGPPVVYCSDLFFIDWLRSHKRNTAVLLV